MARGQHSAWSGCDDEDTSDTYQQLKIICTPRGAADHLNFYTGMEWCVLEAVDMGYGDLDVSNNGLFNEHYDSAQKSSVSAKEQDDAVQQSSVTTAGGDIMNEVVKNEKLEHMAALTDMYAKWSQRMAQSQLSLQGRRQTRSTSMQCSTRLLSDCRSPME